MRSYVPNTPAEQNEMLSSLGLNSMDALFADIPDELKLGKRLKLSDGMSEVEVRRVFQELAKANTAGLPCFRGAGAYNHYIPSIIPNMLARSEFFTAYTPYQAEMSQGMLQSIFEYQSAICAITGLDASNASVYDGATAAAEAMLMLVSATRKRKVLVSEGLNPQVLTVMRTYARFARIELTTVPLTAAGTTDTDALASSLTDTAGFFAAQPNFLGCIEDMEALAAITHASGGLFVNYSNPISLGLLKRPASTGADVAVGEGQPLGIPLSFGGPYLGFMACTAKLMRHMPGRIAGQTTDHEGNRAFVLTLQAREQHIRREKASSNICSNQMLCAISASMYLSVMGPSGMSEIAEQNMQKAHYLYNGISKIKGVTARYPNTPFFNEFTIDVSLESESVNNELKKRGIIGGVPLCRFNGKDKHGMLWCATECNTREEMDNVIGALKEVLS